jgi:perosamine synthetase
VNAPIPLAKVQFTESEIDAVVQVLRSGWVTQGPQVAAFEQALAEYTGATRAVAVSSCTAALHLAMRAMGVGPGDEVIVPGLTWIATANAVELCGGTAVFCDIELETFNLDPAHAESLVTPRTVGIVPVHLFGLAADMDAVEALAARHGLWIVEDAACALGTERNGRRIGDGAHLACFSFHPRKSITTGEGGMLVTNDDALAATLDSLRNHGAGVSTTGTGAAHEMAPFPNVGFNYRLSDIQAALALGQLGRLEDMIAARRACADRYRAVLAGCPGLRLPADADRHSYQSFVCLIDPETPEASARRNAVMATLTAARIGTRPGTHAPARLEAYAASGQSTPRAFLAEDLSLALPLFAGLTESEIDRVAETLQGSLCV